MDDLEFEHVDTLNFDISNEKEVGIFGSFPAHEIKKVFIHELGHYFAQYINSGKDEKWKPLEVELSSRETLGNSRLGGVVRNSFSNQDTVKKESLADSIGSTIMGCVFQSYYPGDDSIYNCFHEEGQIDFSNLSSRKNNLISSREREELKKIEDLFYENLLKDNRLDFIKKLEPKDFISNLNAEDKWQIDLIRLEALTKEPEFKSFKRDYLNFVEDLNGVILQNDDESK